MNKNTARVCSICGKKLKNRFAYAGHMRLTHSKQDASVGNIASETLATQLQKINSKLDRIEKILSQLHVTPQNIPSPQVSPQGSPPPSFLNDNPWVAILSKRGKEPETN